MHLTKMLNMNPHRAFVLALIIFYAQLSTYLAVPLGIFPPSLKATHHSVTDQVAHVAFFRAA